MGAPRITGLGYALPGTVRPNDASVFGNLAVTGDRCGRFDGFGTRRVLAHSLALPDLATEAARAALDSASLPAGACNLLTGRLSLGQWHAPETLSQLQNRLGLPDQLAVLPLASEHTTFPDGLLTAEALLRAGRAQHALVVAAGNWSHYVDYTEDVAFSIGDGAGAAVLSAEADGTSGWRVADYASETASQIAHVMTVKTRPTQDTGTTRPAITFEAEATNLFAEFAAEKPVVAAKTLLARNNVAAQDCTLITYQPSASLMGLWGERLGPHSHLDSLAELGNMNLATKAVNFARAGETIATDYVLITALGWQQQAAALLLARDSATPAPGRGCDPVPGV